MVLELLRKFFAEAMRQAGRDDLAKWAEDAPGEAVKTAARVVMRALGFGKVDEQSIRDVERVRDQAVAAGGAA
ncbi:MAG: hypothetical protein ACREUX_00410, partial [Burkholderiales bacterium]